MVINFIMPITVGILTLLSRITSFEDSNLNIQLIFVLKFIRCVNREQTTEI